MCIPCLVFHFFWWRTSATQRPWICSSAFLQLDLLLHWVRLYREIPETLPRKRKGKRLFSPVGTECFVDQSQESKWKCDKHRARQRQSGSGWAILGWSSWHSSSGFCDITSGQCFKAPFIKCFVLLLVLLAQLHGAIKKEKEDGAPRYRVLTSARLNHQGQQSFCYTLRILGGKYSNTNTSGSRFVSNWLPKTCFPDMHPRGRAIL